MPTTKTRLSIILSPELKTAIEKLAEKDNVSRANKAVQLLVAALEIEEDRLWDELTVKRDVRGAKFIPHKKAWA